MENKENIDYVIKRKSNNNQKETVSYEELLQIAFESTDRICPKDGKNKWYTFDKFNTTFIQDSEKQHTNSSTSNINGEQTEIISHVAVSSDTDQKIEIEDISPLPTPKPKTNQGKSQFIKITSIVFILTTIGVAFQSYIYTKSFDIIATSDNALMELEVNNLLQEGDEILRSSGNHAEANKKFLQVAKIMSTNESLINDSVTAYSKHYINIANQFCSEKNDDAMLKIAIEYYKSAAILTNSKPLTCP